MKYRVYGMLVESDEPLPELDALPADLEPAADITILAMNENAPAPTGTALLPSPKAPDPAWPSLWRGEDDYHLEFGEDATFWLSRDGRRLRYRDGACHAATRNHLLLDQLLPYALYLQGKTPLHATAVAARGRVLAFMADPGQGKSALAAALVSLGCQLVSDDCLVLSEVEGVIVGAPGYRGLRLNTDVREVVCADAPATPFAHYTEKRRVMLGGEAPNGELPIGWIFDLRRRSGNETMVSLEPLKQADAVMALMAQTFRIDLEQREPLKRQLGFFSRVAGAVPVQRCSLASGLDKLVPAAKAILEQTRQA